MIQDYFTLYPQALWVQISQQHMRLCSSTHEILAQELCPVSFDSLGSFAVNGAIAELHFSQLLLQANLQWHEFGQPVVFIQLMDRTESQLDSSEMQALYDMAMNANARVVHIFFKNGETFEQEKLPVKTSRTFHLMMFGAVLLYLIALIAVLLPIKFDANLD